jgi:hypothetical protein
VSTAASTRNGVDKELSESCIVDTLVLPLVDIIFPIFRAYSNAQHTAAVLPAPARFRIALQRPGRTSASGAIARSAGGRASARTSASGAHARSAGDRASACTSASEANARSAGARASARTSVSGADARTSANHRGWGGVTSGRCRGGGFSLGSNARAAAEAPKDCAHGVGMLLPGDASAGAGRRVRAAEGRVACACAAGGLCHSVRICRDGAPHRCWQGAGITSALTTRRQLQRHQPRASTDSKQRVLSRPGC